MPVFSDDINIFESYCKENKLQQNNVIFKNIEDLLKEIPDSELKDKILKEILKIKNNIKYNNYD